MHPAHPEKSGGAFGVSAGRNTMTTKTDSKSATPILDAVLAAPTVQSAVDAALAATPDTLYDSETAESLTAEDLGITDEQYEATVLESTDCNQTEGHVRVNGRRVYAQ